MTEVTILSGSVVRVWGFLEGLLEKRAAELAKADRTMRVVRVKIEGEENHLVGVRYPAHLLPEVVALLQSSLESVKAVVAGSRAAAAGGGGVGNFPQQRLGASGAAAAAAAAAVASLAVASATAATGGVSSMAVEGAAAAAAVGGLLESSGLGEPPSPVDKKCLAKALRPPRTLHHFFKGSGEGGSGKEGCGEGSQVPVPDGSNTPPPLSANGVNGGAAFGGGGRVVVKTKQEQGLGEEGGVLGRGKGGELGVKRDRGWWQQQQQQQEGQVGKRSRQQQQTAGTRKQQQQQQEEGRVGKRVTQQQGRLAAAGVREEGGTIVVLDSDSEGEGEVRDATEVEQQNQQEEEEGEQQQQQGLGEQEQQQGKEEQHRQQQDRQGKEDIMEEGDEDEDRDGLVTGVQRQLQQEEEEEEEGRAGSIEQQQQGCIDPGPMEVDPDAEEADVGCAGQQEMEVVDSLAHETPPAAVTGAAAAAVAATPAAAAAHGSGCEEMIVKQQQGVDPVTVTSSPLLNGTVESQPQQGSPQQQLQGKQRQAQPQQQRAPLVPKALGAGMKGKVGGKAAAVAELLNMGFTQQQAERALWATKGNVQRAVEWCLSGM